MASAALQRMYEDFAKRAVKGEHAEK